jgi:hypothetical protein
MNMTTTAYSAYSVYWYDYNEDPPVGHGMAGRLIDDGTSPVTDAITVSAGMSANYDPPLNGDPKVEGFIDADDNLRVAVTDYVKASQEPVYIHDATDGSQVAGPLDWPEDNLYTLVKFGDFLYAIDYDNAKVIEIDASTYEATEATPYTYTAPAGYQAVGQALIVFNDALYGLFACPNSGWTDYAPSVLVRLDISYDEDLEHNVITADTVNAKLAKNAFAIAGATIGTPPIPTLFVAAIGGEQSAGYNANSRLQSLPASFVATTNPVDRMSPSATLPYEFRDISFKGTTAYVLVGANDANWNLNGKLFSTTDFNVANISTIDAFTGASGYFWSAQYTAAPDRIWYAHGNEVWVYDTNSIATTPAKKTIGDLAGGGSYTNLNDLTYVGSVPGARVSLRGYRSPLQRSRSPLAQALRAITKGRPVATKEEIEQAKASLEK